MRYTQLGQRLYVKMPNPSDHGNRASFDVQGRRYVTATVSLLDLVKLHMTRLQWNIPRADMGL
jgi:hypothetical protein